MQGRQLPVGGHQVGNRTGVLVQRSGDQSAPSTVVPILTLPAPVGVVAAALARAVEAMCPAPLSATLFGSAATGKADRLSDVDLALVRPRGMRRHWHPWLSALVDLDEAWAEGAEARLGTGVEGGLTAVRAALALPGSIWSDAAINGICVGGAPLASLARHPVRFDPGAACARRVRNALRLAQEYIEGAGTLAITSSRISARTVLMVTWPGLRLAADALAGTMTGARVQENRPGEAVATLAGIVGPARARRYGRLAALVTAVDEGEARATARDVKAVVRLGRDFYERALAAGGRPAGHA